MHRVQDYSGVLEALKRGLPTDSAVHIAGGAVRDTILGRDIRDVDFFLDDTCSDAATPLLRALGYVKLGEWRQYEMFSDPNIARVAKFEKADETIPLCLIGLKGPCTPERNVARFDFGICMAHYDGDTPITTDAFDQDADNKTFTLLRADNSSQFAYSMVRHQKLTATRYRDYQLMVPREFKDLAEEYAFRKTWYRADGGEHFGFIHRDDSVMQPKERWSRQRRRAGATPRRHPHPEDE